MIFHLYSHSLQPWLAWQLFQAHLGESTNRCRSESIWKFCLRKFDINYQTSRSILYNVSACSQEIKSLRNYFIHKHLCDNHFSIHHRSVIASYEIGDARRWKNGARYIALLKHLSRAAHEHVIAKHVWIVKCISRSHRPVRNIATRKKVFL